MQYTPAVDTKEAGRFSGGIVFKDGVDSGSTDQYDEAATVKVLNESNRTKVKITSAKLVNFDAEIKTAKVELAAAQKAQVDYEASEEGKMMAAYRETKAVETKAAKDAEMAKFADNWKSGSGK